MNNSMHSKEDKTMTTDEHGHRSTWVLWGFLLIVGSLLFTEHRVHVLGFLPYLLLLACPLMHMFHHGHGGAHRHHDRNSEKKMQQETIREDRK